MKHLFLVVLALLLFPSAFLPQSAAAATRSLYIGLSGSDVTALQNELILRGYLPADKNTGYFGPLTQAAVQKFQCDKGIICANASISGYGIYGPQTRARMTSDISSSPAVSRKNFEFSGWIPYWRAATGTADTLPHLGSLTSVMPFGYTMHNDGTLADTAHLNEEPWKSFIAEAKKKGVRVIPTVMWGDGDSIHRILSDGSKRRALEDEIARTVKENGFDGIDIDFEAKKHETIDYFSTFLRGLYQRMGNKWVYCTVEARMTLDHRYSPGANIPADATDYANDYVEMNKYCDRVEIMAYDQGTIDVPLNAARAAPYAPVADPAWVENLVTLAAKTIDKKKLIIGIPTYGYEYTVTPTSSGDYQYKRLWAFNPRYATNIAAQLNMTPSRTSAGEAGLIYDPNLLPAAAPTGNDAVPQWLEAAAVFSVTRNLGSYANTSGPFNYMTWSDAQAIADKVALAKKLGVRGVAVFKFDGGEDPGMWDVLR